MKYKLLKPLPWIKIWQIFKEVCENDFDYINLDNGYYVWDKFAKEHPDFFEPINERELIYPDNLMEWYVIDGHWWVVEASKIGNSEVVMNQYICWTRFPTKEKAEAYIDLKRDVARFPKVKRWENYLVFYISLNIREITTHIQHSVDYWCWDFQLPLDATDEEKENRVKLLKAYYWF